MDVLELWLGLVFLIVDGLRSVDHHVFVFILAIDPVQLGCSAGGEDDGCGGVGVGRTISVYEGHYLLGRFVTINGGGGRRRYLF